MAHPQTRAYESTLVFDNLDLDLVVKVAAHTVFSPFFTFFVPLIYKGVGSPWTEPTVYISSAWFLLMSTICQYIPPFSHQNTEMGPNRAFTLHSQQVAQRWNSGPAGLGRASYRDHWRLLWDRRTPGKHTGTSTMHSCGSRHPPY